MDKRTEPENDPIELSFKAGLNEEKSILERFGNFEDNIDIIRYNTKLTIRNKSAQIHSLKCGNHDKPNLLFLHGFAGSSMAYVKVLKPLSHHFKCFALDWPGMGLSERWNFGLKHDAQDIIDFFIEVIEEFRKENSISKFSIIGHSFGGYIAANYMKAFPQYVETLFLLSPMGGTQKIKTNNQSTSNPPTAQPRSSLWNKLESYVTGYVKNDRSTPQSILNKWFVPRNYAVSKIIKDTLSKATEEEQKAFIRFYNIVFTLPSIDDSYIHDLVEYPSLDPALSIQEVFSKSSSSNEDSQKFHNVHVLFGDSDFVDSKGCKQLFLDKIWNGSLFFMQDAGHNIMIDQPTNLIEMILKPHTLSFY